MEATPLKYIHDELCTTFSSFIQALIRLLIHSVQAHPTKKTDR